MCRDETLTGYREFREDRWQAWRPPPLADSNPHGPVVGRSFVMFLKPKGIMTVLLDCEIWPLLVNAGLQVQALPHQANHLAAEPLAIVVRWVIVLWR